MEREGSTPEPDPNDVPGRIKFLLKKMIKVADLQMLTTRLCKEHIKESFGELGEEVCAEFKTLIKQTIDEEVQNRAT